MAFLKNKNNNLKALVEDGNIDKVIDFINNQPEKKRPLTLYNAIKFSIISKKQHITKILAPECKNLDEELLFTAMYSNNCEALLTLCNNNNNLIMAREPQDGKTPLITAILFQSIEAVTDIIKIAETTEINGIDSLLEKILTDRNFHGDNIIDLAGEEFLPALKDLLGEDKVKKIIESKESPDNFGLDKNFLSINNSSSYKVGEFYRKKGIYLGEYTPPASSEIKERFNVFAAKKDLLIKSKSFINTMIEVGNIQNTHGHNGIYIRDANELYELIKTRRYNGEWITPTLAMVAPDFALKLNKEKVLMKEDSTLFRRCNEGKFRKTFNNNGLYITSIVL